MTAHVRTLKPFGIPEGMDPHTWRQAIEAQLNDLFDRATALITALDLMEVDCDLEDGADNEAYLAGWSGTNDDREQDNSDNEDDGSAEPEPDRETVQWSQNPLVSQDCPAFHGRRLS
ncbi:hypothetical protein FJ955_03855 [Mesorhizobium sp. B2-2-2]|uniref:hypothetical protein n=1 Tax=Mesorhizobium sp. B2-2-2 TaxID=2589964 RepID=UPI0011282FF5|nr:hypothetical protein [Mesorhizobium sp. B2-2-2]TPM33879.1 hypothetical protein FJ955_03855 [Mesorhizobium sp. B2-2-2]